MKLKMYRWKGVNRLHQTQQGVLLAENEAQAQQTLFARGLQNLKLQQNWQFAGKPKNTEICDLLIQLATLLQSAVPLKDSLQILVQNCTNIPLNLWLRKLLTDIESGHAFSRALENQGQYLSL
ncbi:MAG TPA: type II secretion system F family protein, partial [Pasteurellaceae bacterium]|nr:type II secretion system F family protein [Pasteurellaceae bacterium]